jgi:hypothetical protein
MGKASELDDFLERRRLTPEEEARRHGLRPELRLRADAPAIELEQATPVDDALAELRSKDLGALALRKPTGEIAAMLVTAERYLELVGTELARGSDMEVTIHGRFAPVESAFNKAYVEQVDPHEPWIEGV